MSCPSLLPISLPAEEAEGLTTPPWLADSSELCEEHEETLSMFCLDDLEPLCKQCAAVSHSGHRVYPLTEAATDCKEELRTSLSGLKKRMIDFMKAIQACEQASRHNQDVSRLSEETMKEEFESLHQFLREEEAARLRALRENQEEKKKGPDRQRDQMNEVIKSLEETIQLVEDELDADGDGVKFLQKYSDKGICTLTGSKKPQLMCRPLLDVSKHLGNLQYTVWSKMNHIAPFIPVTFDPRTAGRSLMVSPGLNSVQITHRPAQGTEESVNVPDNPERFQPYSCILAREGFDSGVHCWDVEVGDTSNWTIGVAADSLSRRTEFEACPEAGLWCISLRDGKYRALDSPAKLLNLNESVHLSRVSVRLDWDEGTLEFRDADRNQHLFMFKHDFTEKMYPYFESVSQFGGFTVSAQRVNVSVGSDCVPVEDSGEDLVWENNTVSSTYSDSIMSECQQLTEDKNTVICSVRKGKKHKPQGCSMKDKVTTKTNPTGEEKTKKQKSGPRFNVTYHVSLNKALNSLNNEYK